MNTLTSNHCSHFEVAVHKTYCGSEILVIAGGYELRAIPDPLNY